MAEVSNTFCVLPWMHVATNAAGTLRVCCNSTPGKNGLEHPEGGKYKLHKHDLREAWNCDTMKTIRQQFINGERPEMCERCFREEDAGVRSARHGWNEAWYDANADYSSITPEPKAQYIDLRLGNLCNLKCRMCNPYASNQWVDEWNQLQTEDSLPEEELKRLDTDTMMWPNKQKVWENFMNVADTIDEIYLTGGEPTVIKEQQRLLDYLIDEGIAGNIRLKYNTNLVKMPEWLFDRWLHFKRIQLNCSIDAVGELDHYIRHPSRWQTVLENFERIQTLDNANIEIHCTVQMYNILRMSEFIEWANPYGHKIYFNILNHPEHLNIRVLPNALKQQAHEQLKPYVDLPKVQDIIDYMWHEDWSEKLPAFYKYTHTLDASRSENLHSIVPEFAHYE